MVAAYSPQRWEAPWILLGLPELVGHDRFATSPLRVAHRHKMVELLTAKFLRQPTQHWLDCLR